MTSSSEITFPNRPTTGEQPPPAAPSCAEKRAVVRVLGRQKSSAATFQSDQLPNLGAATRAQAPEPADQQTLQVRFAVCGDRRARWRDGLACERFRIPGVNHQRPEKYKANFA